MAATSTDTIRMVPGHVVDTARAFRRELTPIWLSTATVLSGERGLDLSSSFRAAYLGSAASVTPAVVAAVHPNADVWVWDWRAWAVEHARRLGNAAALDNLEVHERPGLPSNLGGDLVDLIVVEDVLDAAPRQIAAQAIDAIASSLRPGGLVCVTYRTTVGWTEIQPVHRILRHLLRRGRDDAVRVVPEALDFLATLRAGGAKYLTERPHVGHWLDDLSKMNPADIEAEYVERDLRPMSHPQLIEQLQPTGCSYVGSAHLVDDLGADIPEALADLVAAAPTRQLREAYADIAVRRASRTDVFRLGRTRQRAEVSQRLDALELMLLTVPGARQSLNDAIAPARECRPIRLAEIDGDLHRAIAKVRSLLDAGQVHPLAPTSTPQADAAANRLNAELEVRPGVRLRALPRLGTAVAPELHAAVLALDADA